MQIRSIFPGAVYVCVITDSSQTHTHTHKYLHACWWRTRTRLDKSHSFHTISKCASLLKQASADKDLHIIELFTLTPPTVSGQSSLSHSRALCPQRDRARSNLIRLDPLPLYLGLQQSKQKPKAEIRKVNSNKCVVVRSCFGCCCC